jgi:multicomponent Na+:H+ antiporter subunit E
MMPVRVLAIGLWAYAVWLVITWTATAEQLIFGATLSLLVAIALAPLGEIAGPWRLLDPRRAGACAQLLLSCAMRIVRANVSLARRILAPSRPLRSGMVIVPTEMRTDAGIGATGLITSLIVDNQIIDLDRRRHVLQYHAVAVPDGDDRHKSEQINAPIERLIARIDRR